MTTIHAFTSDQRILDNSHKDPRRARSASQSIVPTSTGASKTIGEIIPSLKGKLEGVAMRVPTPNVSLVELVFCAKKDLSIEKINSAFQIFSEKNKVLEITNEKLVSIDFNHNSASSIVDATLTNGLVKIWVKFLPGMIIMGFSNRMRYGILSKFLNKKIKIPKSYRKVLLRLDLNVPLSQGKITDETRIDKILPTINYLLKENSKF